MPDDWVCNGGLFWHRDFSAQYHVPEDESDQPNVTATCSFVSADSPGGKFYRRGFSFHLLLAICIVNLATALGIYGLWLYGNRQSAGTRRECNTFPPGPGRYRYRRTGTSALWRRCGQPHMKTDPHGEEYIQSVEGNHSRGRWEFER